MEFTSLERAVISFLADRAPHPLVGAQLRASQPVHREFTGAGSYTTLRVPPGTAAVPPSEPFLAAGMPLEGVEVSSPSLSAGACALVWFEQGTVSTLELAGPGISDHEFPFSLRGSSASPA